MFGTVFIQHTTFSHANPGNSSNFSFIKPLYIRFTRDNEDMWGNHFRWEMGLGNELVWGVIIGETSDTKYYYLDLFNNNVISSSLLGTFYWTKNVFYSDKFLASVGINFGDVAVGTNWSPDSREGAHFGIGPDVFVDYALTGNWALGANISAFKSVLHYTEDKKPNTDLWVYT